MSLSSESENSEPVGFEPALNDILSPLTVADLTVEGGSVARHEGRVVFLDQGLPGDVVSARIQSVKKRVIFAEVVQILSASPHTEVPWCSHFNECGACSWQHFSLDATLTWKEKHLRETLTRIGKVTGIAVQPIMPSPVYRACRNKMSYAFAPGEGSELALGLRKRKTHDLVNVTDCGMQPPVVMDLLAFVRERARELQLPAWRKNEGYLRFLVVHTPLFEPDGKPQMLVECITGLEPRGRNIPSEDKDREMPHADRVRLLGTELMERFSLTGFVHTERRHSAELAQGERMVRALGASEYFEKFEHITLRVPYNAFLQTNTGAATLLYEQIALHAGLTGTECVWDLYTGVGSIALFLAKDAREVHGFDIHTGSILAARKNSRLLGYDHCGFHAGDMMKSLNQALTPPDIVILDPPRSGLDASIVEMVKKLPARKMLYMSCDAGTQARDVARLISETGAQTTQEGFSGWEIEKSIPCDMFPYTPHVENVIVFSRAAR